VIGSVGLAAAFIAGFVSFLSPCILPLIPAYLSFMTGLTTAELSASERQTARVMVPALLFVLGFSLVFIALGASASVLGQFLSQYRLALERIGGLFVVAFGVLMLGIVKVPWLYGEARADMSSARTFGKAAALVMGVAFAAGWTPCVGPILGTILGLASATGSVARGALLLVAYSAGLGIPFLVVALAFDRAAPLMKWLNRYSVVVNRIAGIVLIFVGVLIATGRLVVLASWLARFVPTIGV
jgi:cytochrome c-type biogenesis protein